MIETQAVVRVIRFWMGKVRELRIKLELANSDYADLLMDFYDAQQYITELERIAGRVEDRASDERRYAL